MGRGFRRGKCCGGSNLSRVWEGGRRGKCCEGSDLG